MSDSGNKPFGIVAEFESPAAIFAAAQTTTGAGYTRVDAHTPFPVHGLDHALKQGPSHVGWIVVCGGLLGIAAAQVLQWWTNAYDYEFWVSGKLPYAWPTTIPITFELMVLLSAFAAVIGMFGINKLPRLYSPIFKHSTFWRATDDRFFLSIDAKDPQFDATKTVAFLEGLGGAHVELLEEE